jgi:hypothetical protein
MLSESLDSLTRTSYSSEGRQEVKDGEDHDDNEDDVESCCGSLTYSIESEWFVHHQNHEHQYYYPHTVSTMPQSDTDIYEDALERLDNQNTTKVLSSKKNHARNNNNCFQPATGGCFQPLAWVADLFRRSSSSSSSPTGNRSMLLCHEDDDETQDRIEDF